LLAHIFRNAAFVFSTSRATSSSRPVLASACFMGEMQAWPGRRERCPWRYIRRVVSPEEGGREGWREEGVSHLAFACFHNGLSK